MAVVKKLIRCAVTVLTVSIVLSTQASAQGAKPDDGKASTSPVSQPPVTAPKPEQSIQLSQPTDGAKGVKNFVLLPKPPKEKAEQTKDTTPKDATPRPPEPLNCPEKVEGVENTGQFDFQMGDWIQVCVAGLTQQELPKTASLYFDGLKIPTTATRVVTQDPKRGNILYLSFYLTRDSLTTASREAWDAYLRTKRGIESPVSVAVSLGNDNLPPQSVLSPAEARFSVANGKVIHVTLWAGIAIFVVAYFVLVRHDSILRDFER